MLLTNPNRKKMIIDQRLPSWCYQIPYDCAFVDHFLQDPITVPSMQPLPERLSTPSESSNQPLSNISNAPPTTTELATFSADNLRINTHSAMGIYSTENYNLNNNTPSDRNFTRGACRSIFGDLSNGISGNYPSTQVNFQQREFHQQTSKKDVYDPPPYPLPSSQRTTATYLPCSNGKHIESLNSPFTTIGTERSVSNQEVRALQHQVFAESFNNFPPNFRDENIDLNCALTQGVSIASSCNPLDTKSYQTQDSNNALLREKRKAPKSSMISDPAKLNDLPFPSESCKKANTSILSKERRSKIEAVLKALRRSSVPQSTCLSKLVVKKTLTSSNLSKENQSTGHCANYYKISSADLTQTNTRVSNMPSDKTKLPRTVFTTEQIGSLLNESAAGSTSSTATDSRNIARGSKTITQWHLHAKMACRFQTENTGRRDGAQSSHPILPDSVNDGSSNADAVDETESSVSYDLKTMMPQQKIQSNLQASKDEKVNSHHQKSSSIRVLNRPLPILHFTDDELEFLREPEMNDDNFVALFWN